MEGFGSRSTSLLHSEQSSRICNGPATACCLARCRSVLTSCSAQEQHAFVAHSFLTQHVPASMQNSSSKWSCATACVALSVSHPFLALMAQAAAHSLLPSSFASLRGGQHGTNQQHQSGFISNTYQQPCKLMKRRPQCAWHEIPTTSLAS